MALAGTLKDFSLADIFQLIALQKKTGYLTLRNETDVVTVTFLEGSVVGAESLNKRIEIGQRRVKFHSCSFRGQVNIRSFNPLDFLQAVLDCSHAVCAGHTRNR